ncbi:hypothetical protein V1639_05820 [Pseudarthrobacter sp. J75]|uniref:hypothetical protein n=1 Tax=unclassified Pseudarthrobacter TaxID=2647000 RepID=UPI002E80D4E8|nr:MULTISPECIES: hypothetical protein [unclassified Pseudarthrobacter]MEE2521316.1 hypothetical protein [Pseudarthrobacter sp. J47]MEE2528548.1 hypothetical protein [Pseudarthrobacter sp. J75]
MLSLVIVVLVLVAAGFIVWANDKRHTKYGMVLPAGVAVAIGVLAWIICIMAGFSYRPGLTWLPWILPMVVGSLAAVAAAIYLGRTRHVHDIHRLTQILRRS